MAAVVGLTSLKDFQYRGKTEEWSNTYHFSGAIPASPAEWRALYDALVAIEKTMVRSSVRFIGGYGYDKDDADRDAVWTLDLLQAPNTPVLGTFAGAAGNPLAPGDAAFWIRWKTSRTNSKGKAIYLRKYFHGAIPDATSGGDTFSTAQAVPAAAFAAKMDDGTFIDGRKLRSRHNADTLVGHGVSAYLTTRTLKRRGKRPT